MQERTKANVLLDDYYPSTDRKRPFYTTVQSLHPYFRGLRFAFLFFLSLHVLFGELPQKSIATCTNTGVHEVFFTFYILCTWMLYDYKLIYVRYKKFIRAINICRKFSPRVWLQDFNKMYFL